MKLKHQEQFYSCCRCLFPGRHCETFEKDVNAEFINKCKSLTQSERISLVIDEADKVDRKLKNLCLDKVWYNYYKNMYDETHHFCQEADDCQKEKDARIINALEKLDLSNTNYDNVKILFLGHYDLLLENVNNSILVPTNLNTIKADEKYKGNEWAESRAFLLKDELLATSAEYIGFATANWNNKFIGENIHGFEQWIYSKYLLNAGKEVKIVLCGDVNCVCLWKNSLRTIFSNNQLFDQFLDYFDLTLKHIKVPFCNQFIAHRSIIQEYLEFLHNNNIFEKVRQFTLDFITPFYVRDPIRQNRSEAYIIEMITCFWFAYKNYYYIPNGIRTKQWYGEKNIEKREKEYVSSIST